MLDGVPYGRGVFRHLRAVNPDPRVANWLYVGDFNHGTFHGAGRFYSNGRENHIGHFLYGDSVGINSSIIRLLMIIGFVVIGFIAFLILLAIIGKAEGRKKLKEVQSLRLTNPTEYRLRYGSYEDADKLVLRSDYIPPPGQHGEAIVNKSDSTLTLTFPPPLNVSYIIPISKVKSTTLSKKERAHKLTFHAKAGDSDEFSLDFSTLDSLGIARKIQTFITSASNDSGVAMTSSNTPSVQPRCMGCGAWLDFDNMVGNLIECKFCGIKTRMI